MARTYYATTVHEADGVTTDYEFSFAGVSGDTGAVTPYISPEDVRAEEQYELPDGTQANIQRPCTLIAPNRVRIAGAPVVAGRTIRIYRSTELRYPLVDYRDRQSVSEFDLDLSARQAVFLSQENYDANRGAGDIGAQMLAEAVAAAVQAQAAADSVFVGDGVGNIPFNHYANYAMGSLGYKTAQMFSVRDTIRVPVDGSTDNWAGIEEALARAEAIGADLYWPAGQYVSNAPHQRFHRVRHWGPGVLLANGHLHIIDPKPNQANTLFVSPGGTGDGLAPGRPMAGIMSAVEALHMRAPLVAEWTVQGTQGTYSEDVILPDNLTRSSKYLTFTFPAPEQQFRAEPSTYPAVLSGVGRTGLQGFLSGAGNRIRVINLCIAHWYDPALPATSQVRRGFAGSHGSFSYLVNCAYMGNGLANVSALPGGTVIITGGVLDGARYGVDDTAGRVSMSATTTTYAVIRNALEYGLYAKHEGSTVMDYTEFRNCGNHPLARDYGSAIFMYKSNTSVDTRGCKFFGNNICKNARGGFGADHPGIPDIYGVGTEANKRIYLNRAGGKDDIQSYEASTPQDITKRFTGGATTNSVDTVLLDKIASTRWAYFAHLDQKLEITLLLRAQNGDGLFTPRLRLDDLGIVSLGTYRVASGKFGEVRLVIRPALDSKSLSVKFSCTDAIQNLGAAVGRFITPAVDLMNTGTSFEMVARAEAGTATFLSSDVHLFG